MYSVVKMEYPNDPSVLWSCGRNSIMITGNMFGTRVTRVGLSDMWWDTDYGGVRVL